MTKRIIARIGIGISIVVLAAILVAVVGVLLLLRTGRVQAYVLRLAQAQLTTAVGAPVRIGSLSLHLASFTPGVDAYNITVDGAPPYANPPFLRVDHVHIGIQITSLWRRSWYFSALVMDHPVVCILITPSGRTNVPQGPGPAPNPFQLGIYHAVVHRGEVIVNQRATPLAADLRQVGFQSAFHPVQRRYTGTLSYGDGQLQIAGYHPIAHSLDLAFSATPSGVTVSPLVLSSGNSRLQASVEVSGYVHPRVFAQYQLRLDAAQVRAPVRAIVSVSGTAQVADGIVNADGRFSSPVLEVAASGRRVPVSGLSGNYRLAQGNLAVSAIRATVLGGQVTAALSVRDLAGAAAAQLQATLHGLDLAQFAPRRLGITGTLDATTTVQWQGAFKRLQLAVNATLAGAVASAPVRAAVNAHYSAATGALALLSTSLETPASSISATGTIAARSSLQARARTANLADLESLADHIAAALGHPLPPQGLAGAGTFSGTVSGSLTDPEITGQLDLTNLEAHGTRWRSLAASFDASPSQLRLSHAELLAAPAGSITVAATLGLDHGAFRDTSPVDISLHASALSLALLDTLLGQPLPVSGTLAAQLSLTGTLRRPQGQGSATLTSAVFTVGALHQSIQAVTVTFRGTGNRINASLTAQLPAGAVRAQGSFDPPTGAYQAELHADNIQLDRLALVAARRLPVEGIVSLVASGQGTLANPAAQLLLTAPSLRVADQAINAIRLQADLANHDVRAQLSATALDVALHGQAEIGLRDGLPATASLDAPAVPLAPLLVAYAPDLAEQLSGQTALHATLQGPLRRLGQLQAHLELPTLRLNFHPAGAVPIPLAAIQPVHLDLVQGVLTLQPAHLAGASTDLHLSGAVPLAGAAPMKLGLQGTVDLKLIQAFFPDLVTAGELTLDVAASGVLAHPAVLSGDIQLANFSVSNPGWPVGLQHGNGAFRLHSDRVDISHFAASLGGGTLTATGGISFQPAPQFDLALAARQVRFSVPATVRESVNADLALTGNLAGALLGGRVQVNSVAATPQFDFTNFLSQVSNATTAIAAPGSFVQNLSLNLTVTTPNQIATTTRDFSIQANANVSVRGTAAEPVVLGRVNLNSGDLIFRGNRYVIQSGTLDFVNPGRTEANVTLDADTTIQQYDLHLHFQGPTDNLRTTYTSNPALPPADIINLLAFGQTTEASGANAAPGNLGAENLIASAVSGQITGKVQKLVGLSQLSIDPEVGGGQNAGTRITVQQRVTGNLFVTVATDIAGTERNVVDIQYQLSPRVSLSAVRDQNGGFGVNASFKKTW